MITEQREEIKDLLEAEPYFDDINIFLQDDKDIEQEIERALGPMKGKGGKSGACVMIVTAKAGPRVDSEFGPVWDLSHALRILESPVVNRGTSGSGKTHAAIAERIATTLHGITLTSAAAPLMIEPPGITPADDPRFPGSDIAFATSGQLAATLPQCATPAIAEDAGELTLTCDTAGAALFYTTNGKNPSPRNGTLYTAPFTPDPLLTVKVRAWLAGYLASEIATVNT
jgi:hypothetical protein